MISKDLHKAIKILVDNKLVAIPTETVYGLAANAYNEDAVKKIFELKKRPSYNPLIIHIKSAAQLNDVAKDIPEKALQLAKHFWPGPLTLVLKKKDHIPDIVTAAKDTVAIRVPNHALTLELLNKLDFPLAAPSANPFGSISPTCAEHVLNYFKDDLEVILDGGPCEKGIESTIIGFENKNPVLYRLGSISQQEIEKVIGNLSAFENTANEIKAPGMLSRHYAPKTEIFLTNRVKELIKSFPNKKIGLLLFKDNTIDSKNYLKEVLSEEGDMNQAAKNLYAALHRLDKSNLDLIIAEKFPNEGIGKSINDRLQRATQK
jgi:L-threonylcarbamoyladenylate synthase